MMATYHPTLGANGGSVFHVVPCAGVEIEFIVYLLLLLLLPLPLNN
jgi:hypothetical protein